MECIFQRFKLVCHTRLLLSVPEGLHGWLRFVTAAPRSRGRPDTPSEEPRKRPERWAPSGQCGLKPCLFAIALGRHRFGITGGTAMGKYLALVQLAGCPFVTVKPPPLQQIGENWAGASRGRPTACWHRPQPLSDLTAWWCCRRERTWSLPYLSPQRKSARWRN
jgi:hypothetical protein